MGIARREYKIEYPSLDGPKVRRRQSRRAPLPSPAHPPRPLQGFQNYVRAHQNFVEGIAPVTVLLLVAGLAEPTVWVAFSAGGAYFIGRILYAWGYARSENNGEGRIPGVVLIDLALLTMFGLAIYSCVLMATTQA